jgi:nucleotide-binding universal stress UspA family protein
MQQSRTILVPVDFSTHSQAAAIRACGLASASGANVRLLHALDPVAFAKRDDFSEALWDEVRRGAERDLDALHRSLADRGASVHSLLEEKSAVDMVLAHARPEDVDLIVMGPHGFESGRRMFLGSVAEGVVRRATVPVVTVKGDELDAAAPIRRILLATDFSPNAANALSLALQWAAWLGADVEAFHALGIADEPAADAAGSEPPTAHRDAALEGLRGILQRMRAAGIPASAELTHGPASIEIVKRATRSHSDLVILGRRGRDSAETVAFGRVTDRVLRHARSSVMLAGQTEPALI